MINQVRRYLRNTGYLNEPKVEKTHLTIDGKKLHSDLLTFTTTAKENIVTYVTGIINNEDDIKLKAVYVTEEEFLNANKVENLSKNEITFKIFEIMEYFSETDRKIYEDMYKKNVKNKKKEIHVTFYYELRDAFESTADLCFSSDSSDTDSSSDTDDR